MLVLQVKLHEDVVFRHGTDVTRIEFFMNKNNHRLEMGVTAPAGVVVERVPAASPPPRAERRANVRRSSLGRGRD